MRLGLGLGLGLGLPALGAVAYIGHRRSLSARTNGRNDDGSMLDASPSIQRPPAPNTAATEYAEMED